MAVLAFLTAGVSDFTATRGGNRCAAQPSGAAPLRTVDGLTQVITTNSNERTSSGVTFGPVTGELYVIAMPRLVVTPVTCSYLPPACINGYNLNCLPILQPLRTLWGSAELSDSTHGRLQGPPLHRR